MQRTRRHVEGDVELNLAAMLDMAFQLLAFFILTYRPVGLEGYIAVRMPAVAAVTQPVAEALANTDAATTEDAASMAGVETLQIEVTAQTNGAIKAIRVAGHAPVSSVHAFEQKLQSFGKVCSAPFERVVLKVSPNLGYENVLRLVEICARSKLTGEHSTKLNIVELASLATSIKSSLSPGGRDSLAMQSSTKL